MMLALALALVPQASPRSSLQTEDLEGHRGTLAVGLLPLSDPRQAGAWIIRPEGFPAPASEAGRAAAEARVVLANGDELSARVVGGKGETLELELVGGVTVPFRLEGLRSLRFPARVPADQRLALAPAPEGDRLYRRTLALDALDGTLEGFESEGVRFDSVLGQRTIPWEEVGAFFVEPLDAPAERQASERVPVIVGFAGDAGGRVRGHLVALEREVCRLLVGQTEVALPLSAVAELVVDDGRLTYLSGLEPSAESGRGAPFGDELGMSWPHRMDRNVLGGELRSGGQAYRHGIGMHAPSRLTFTLDGGYRQLRGRLAIDDSTRRNPPAARGNAVFRVLADGKALFESASVRGGDAPLELPPLDLAGVHELVLEVDPVGDFAGDRANWLDPVLIR